tara:strand:- start:2285 stop:2917 length:633 start_codon:yes stop_codon:yes gene_type:complete
METQAARPRGRPRVNPLKSAVEMKKAAVVAEAVVEEVRAPIERPEIRGDVRASVREEDPRTRASRRAAEIRNNIGSLDEGTDDFYVDQNTIPPGWDYEWKRKTVLNQEDPAYQVQLARTGWEPVPADRHPSYMPDGNRHSTIERKGMILMERPKELTEEARDVELRKARNQVRHKEAQLNSAPDGQFGRDHDQVKARIGKSYEAIPIPKD